MFMLAKKFCQILQLGTCIYINVWFYIHRISLCQLKSYKLVSHFIMRKTFALYFIHNILWTLGYLSSSLYYLSLSISLSLTFSFFKMFWNNRLVLFSLTKIWHYAMSAFLLGFSHINHIKSWASNFYIRMWYMMK